MKKKLLTFSLLGLLAIGLRTSTASASTYYPSPDNWDISTLAPGEEKSAYFSGGFTITIGRGPSYRVMGSYLSKPNNEMKVFSMNKK